jgi:hypothetical protein
VQRDDIGVCHGIAATRFRGLGAEAGAG